MTDEKHSEHEHPDHPYGSLVEQTHRVMTVDQGVDSWVIAEEIVKGVQRATRRELAAKPPTLAPYTYQAVVCSVYDGDTIHADIDMGFGIWNRGTASRKHEGQLIRLNGCNARELSEPGGPEARDNLAALLPAGTVLLLRSAAWDKYGGRIDADIQLPDGSDLVQTLVAGQWVAPWDGTGTRPVPPWPRTV